ncbi:amino acid ABC transporter ATP-binding/permease protein [Clostridium sp. Marseille-P299]|uniref:amino acid ABC transporter ATP-binding/permease protein n=1 Tax=Clostridium sp. Marseille-P299 TaxID=1805477 RepID=UPI00082F5F40|nr:ABC transporter ATP-binding protein [Clostridium sp. Marseille-P299]
MRRSGIKIMGNLIGLVKPLIHVMLVAIAMGVVGFLCSIFISILGGYAILDILNFEIGISLKTIFILLILCAVFRGILRYAEQACNHFIAFKLLAIIRNKVFTALRRLAPAKLEGKDKGNIIAIITSDIELLEVFYAHTISPIVIAVLTSAIMVLFIGRYHFVFALIAVAGYITVGVIIPLIISHIGKDTGSTYRNEFGELNSVLLDSLRGLSESIQYQAGDERLKEINDKTKKIEGLQKNLKKFEGLQSTVTDMAILVFFIVMFVVSLVFYNNGYVGFDGVIIPSIAMMSSFGPVVALSNLSNNLLQTLASGNRVLDLLEEEPMVEDIIGKKEVKFEGIKAENVTFSYDNEVILENFSLDIQPNQIYGIQGKSGSGKSTLLKLFMRFWDVNSGAVKVSNQDVREINTSNLRDMESYVTQETYLFHDTIANNIKIAKLDATMEEVISAAKRASVHDFIMSLPKGYDTNVGELGDSLSGGEKQRIGIARAFLHDAPFLMLDEPTSNLDSLNEGIILKSLKEECKNKTVLFVSHRASTLNIADTVFKMNEKRVS